MNNLINNLKKTYFKCITYLDEAKFVIHYEVYCKKIQKLNIHLCDRLKVIFLDLIFRQKSLKVTKVKKNFLTVYPWLWGAKGTVYTIQYFIQYCWQRIRARVFRQASELKLSRVRFKWSRILLKRVRDGHVVICIVYCTVKGAILQLI